MAVLSEGDKRAVSLFVDEMRSQREARGWSQAELARQANCSESLIAMVETYQRAPSQSLARSLDRAFGTPGFTEDAATGTFTPGTFSRLWSKLRTISLPTRFRPFAEREAEATALRTFEHSFIPGLLQTADYARAVVATKPGATDADIETDVADRVARQWILTRDAPPPYLWALIDEGALYRPVAPPLVMHEQFDHLLAMSARPNVSIQVVPYAAGGHTGLLGAFVMAEVPVAPRIVYVDDISGGRVAEDATDVDKVALRFETIRSEALPTKASRDLIARVDRERWTA
jgi:transcriptional regulator with XRE-family HTH domain